MTNASPLPAPSAALSRRLEAVATRYLLERFTGPGNPMKTQVLQLGSMVATKVPFLPTNAVMNAVHGLEDSIDLTRVLAFYAETNQPCWIELPPHVDASVTSALRDNGFRRLRYPTQPASRTSPQPGLLVGGSQLGACTWSG